jgi:hypothetical protein
MLNKETDEILLNTIAMKIKGRTMANGQIHVIICKKPISPCSFALVLDAPNICKGVPILV